MPLQKVVAVQDDSGHWYVIPQFKHELFNDLQEMGEEGESEFIEAFNEYRTNGDLNNIQLYAEI